MKRTRWRVTTAAAMSVCLVLTLTAIPAQADVCAVVGIVQIVHEIDPVAAANIQGCANSAVVEFADINALAPDNLQVFTMNLKAVLVAGNDTLVTALPPSCDHVDENGGEPCAPRFYMCECTAYNGNIGVAKVLATSQNQAASNTSRAVAQAELPILSA